MSEAERIKQIATSLGRYELDSETGCWNWTGATLRSGHGVVKVLGKLKGAHRVVFQHFRGPIGEGLHLHHTCENPACVNPAHLLPVTPGEHASIHAKLELAQVREIRRMFTEEVWKQEQLASIFEVDQTTISRIVRGVTWRRPEAFLWPSATRAA